MSAAKLEYRITRQDDKFVVIDSEEELVGIFDTDSAAQTEIAREQRDDAIWDRTKELVRHAVRAVMKEFGVSQEIALYWVNSAMGITPLGMRGKARP
jgi:hypothetical protein